MKSIDKIPNTSNRRIYERKSRERTAQPFSPVRCVVFVPTIGEERAGAIVNVVAA